MILFNNIINSIREALNKPLPGTAAQHLMAPRLRPTTEELLLQNPSPRLSSVMLLLYPDQQGQLLTVFIERPVNDSIHSGQIAFPGGKVDPGDVNPAAAALRETEEEIGVSMIDIEIIGTLSHLFIPASKFLVIPHVGVMNFTPVFIPNPAEVKSIISVPISFIQEMVPSLREFPTSYGNLTAPYFDLHGHAMWGATAMMVSEFREILRNMKV